MALLAVLLAMAWGCGSSTCSRDEVAAQEYRAGRTSVDGTFYESNQLAEPYLHFPPGRRYRFHHGLLGVPQHAKAYLSFSQCPFSTKPRNNRAGEAPACDPPTDEDSQGYAESAGNQVIHERATERYVEIRNDTCAEFYVRLTATYHQFSDPAPDGGTPP